MQKFIRKQIYKSRQPYDTIQYLRGILYDCDIFLKEKLCRHEDSLVTATMLQFGDDCFKDVRIGTNGKGMNSRYALASAYGEMMERLQCQMLMPEYRRKAFAEGRLDFLMAPDETYLPFGDVMEECGSYFRALLRLPEQTFDDIFQGLEQKKCLCIPFYDESRGKSILLPFELIAGITSSNGMCAGNTPQEALNQGISELYERSALTLIYRNNPEIPFLPDELFEDTEILKRLRDLRNFGYDYRILDCSMGMDYPVIGLILSCDDGIMMNLGADPNAVVALERCLTEQFQLVRPELVRMRFSRESCGLAKECDTPEKAAFYHEQLRRSSTMGSGLKPENIVHPCGTYADHFTCNEDPSVSDLSYLTALTRRIGYHLLYRDCSWLGFPSYISLIPEISFPDFNTLHAGRSMAKWLEHGLPVPESLPCYEDVLPILKRLDRKYLENLPKQKKVET